MKGNRWIALIFLAQVACGFFFVSDIILNVFGLRATPVQWQTRELLEIGAAIGLILGTILGVIVVFRSLRRTAVAEDRLRLASGAFAEVMEEKFSHWRLTLAERDVAMFAIKGMTTAEIARLRETSEGTVKAQTNAIYRKAGVSGRPQLLSLFIDDLMGDSIVPAIEDRSV